MWIGVGSTGALYGAADRTELRPAARGGRRRAISAARRANDVAAWTTTATWQPLYRRFTLRWTNNTQQNWSMVPGRDYNYNLIEVYCERIIKYWKMQNF